MTFRVLVNRKYVGLGKFIFESNSSSGLLFPHCSKVIEKLNQKS